MGHMMDPSTLKFDSTFYAELISWTA